MTPGNPVGSSRSFSIGGQAIARGERKKVQLEVASLYDYTKISIPIEVIRGNSPGPTLFISAAIHGDEINGVEIVKRLLQRKSLRRINGTLILIPIVNVFGFNSRSRYLPDRRDLNRCFPESENGSLGARLARIFMKEIVGKCTHGIDLHTGAIHRTNLPQIRASLDDLDTKKLAMSFGVPVVINSSLRDGSLREAARKKKVKTLLFEGGEALRFNESVIKAGVHGCLAVMQDIGMISMKSVKTHPSPKKVYIANQSYWVRASHSGSFKIHKQLGEQVETGEKLATITDPFGEDPHHIYAQEPGIIIGLSTIPLVNKGDAMVHIANFVNSTKVRKAIELFDEVY